MAKMLKNIPVIVLIVVLVAVNGINDVLCGSSVCKNEGEMVTDVLHAGVEAGAANMMGDVNQTTMDIVPDRATNIFSRLTKKQIITISLVGTAVVILSSFAALRANNSPKEYDIVKEAKQVSSVLGNSSGNTYEELNRITTALCTKLSDSPDDPPLDTSTLAATTEIFTTNKFTTRAESTEMRTTEAMTTVALPSEDAELLCPPVAEKVFGYMKNVIGKSTDGFVVFDTIDESNKNAIFSELRKVETTNCKANFFKYGNISNHEGLSFKSTNVFIANLMEKNACKMAVDTILSVLYDLGYDSESTGFSNAKTLNFKTDEMRTTFLEGEAIANNKDCGGGFFEITDDGDEKTIKYENSNTYISDGWPKVINHKKCQKRADGVIAVLYEGGYSDFSKTIQMTAYENEYDKEFLEAAYARGENSSCGKGALHIIYYGQYLNVLYHNTNPYVIKAWENAPEILTCKHTGKNVFNYLLELGLYSKDDDAAIIVPKRDKNIETLKQKIVAADGYYCEEGFFTLGFEDFNYKIKFNKNNPYIKVEYDKLTNDDICEATATGVYNILKSYEKTINPGRNFIALPLKDSLRIELRSKIDNVADSNCGDGFFGTSIGINYLPLDFSMNNRYMKTQWLTVQW